MKKILASLFCLLLFFAPFNSYRVSAKNSLSVANNYETFNFKIDDLQRWINKSDSEYFNKKKYVFKKSGKGSKRVKLKEKVYIYAYIDKENKNRVFSLDIIDKDNGKNEDYIKNISKLFIKEFGADDPNQVISQAEDVSRNCDGDKDQGIYIFNHVNYKVIFNGEQKVCENDFSPSKFNMDQDYRSSSDYASFCDSVTSKNEYSNTPSESQKHIYDNATVESINSGSGSELGEYSIIHVASSQCTDDNLLDWYLNYVKPHSEYKYNIILYTDNSGYGVYSANGIIQKNVGLSQSNGSYGVAKTDGCTTYYVTEDGKLQTVQ
ncbi:hypothetical protein EDX97_07770 [Absicoccus porci]|uniref:Uncharacterized protein n=1 Tax=Absicoccus porci TaxID=2486576 RepID=A0A3N0I0X0_9FIRM|nr:hypothetical protein [Absicoccus porci]RNM30669.1 hypothetical protein EDX97_07770 [Absicoccus porci]